MRPDQSFKGRQFTAEVILWAVRWYLMFPISYRDLELMLAAAVEAGNLDRPAQRFNLLRNLRRRACLGSLGQQRGRQFRQATEICRINFTTVLNNHACGHEGNVVIFDHDYTQAIRKLPLVRRTRGCAARTHPLPLPCREGSAR